MSALTQVADTPAMWMNRAFILERGVVDHLDQDPSRAEQDIAQAADAYRAALQVMKHPDAQLGLSLTGRMMAGEDALKDEKVRSLVYAAQRKDSSALMTEFLGASNRLRAPASLFGGVMALEQAAENARVDWSDELFEFGEGLTNKSLNTEGVGEILDANVVRSCFENDEDATRKEEKRSDFPLEVSLQRQILHEPDRPELWLSLARNLVGSLDESSPNHSIESAIAAAQRATSMMTENLARPHRIHGNAASFLDAEMVSEGLSLIHWLRRSEGEKEEKSDDLSTYELQRSLMMCPNNPLAREALKQSQ
jgi:hypothetical protein